MVRVRAAFLLAFALAVGRVPGLPGGRAAAQTPPPASRTLVDAAVRQAGAEHKVVLVVFGASWCGWCRRFHDMLADSGVGPILAAHYVAVNLTAQESPAKRALENPGSDSLMAALGGAKGGLPFFAALDSAGARIADSNLMPGGGNVGFPSEPDEVAAFDRFLANTAPRITAAERERVRAYLDRIAGREASGPSQ